MTGNRFRSFRLIFNVSIQAYAATATPAKGDISIKSRQLQLPALRFTQKSGTTPAHF
jgi:hypothetical protein